MSVEQAKVFIEKMKSDAAFRNRVYAIEDVAGRLAFINNEGFACTAEEIQEVKASLELSDEQLDAVAGGKGALPGYTETKTNAGEIQSSVYTAICA
ncbi:MAG: Nif11-like leader peptide family natural product precursor [Chlorobiaceae bacterium]